MGLEIERKFLVKQVPWDELQIITMSRITQHYLSVNVEEEVRIRKSVYKGGVSKCSLTKKKEKAEHNGLVRTEDSMYISDKTFINMLADSRSNPLFKSRYVFKHEKYTIELDVYDDFKDFVIAEVEFNSVKDAEEFCPPYWFDQDVTEQPGFKNKNLWKSLQEVEPDGSYPHRNPLSDLKQSVTRVFEDHKMTDIEMMHCLSTIMKEMSAPRNQHL